MRPRRQAHRGNDAADIDMQIVSLTAPGVEQLEAAEAISLAAETNDFVADAMKEASDAVRRASPRCQPRPRTRPRRSSSGRCAGAIINGHIRGRYLDDKFYWPILECAEQLGAPIYLHPTRPPQPVIAASFSGFSLLVSDLFAGRDKERIAHGNAEKLLKL